MVSEEPSGRVVKKESTCGDKATKPGDNEKAHRNETAKSMLISVVCGVIGGILVNVFVAVLVVKQNEEMASDVSRDTVEYCEGAASLRWEFVLQPRQTFRWAQGGELGCFLHFEFRPNSEGRLSGLNMSKTHTISFWAKSSVQGLRIDEFNLFTGKEFLQYIQRYQSSWYLGTRWQKYCILVDECRVAPWEIQWRAELLKKLGPTRKPDLSDVTALGWDIKNTTADRRAGTIWIDDVRLIDSNQVETALPKSVKTGPLSQREAGSKLTSNEPWGLWVSNFRVYR